ncbi:MAG: hypothetical protein KJO61_11205 [Deltaproteobacteria bacterium]|nr:hypothetical protein [Deltaproteobacteria bacterium]NNK85096.1 hypothetical protein [Desulfobacterales bacterium]
MGDKSCYIADDLDAMIGIGDFAGKGKFENAEIHCARQSLLRIGKKSLKRKDITDDT